MRCAVSGEITPYDLMRKALTTIRSVNYARSHGDANLSAPHIYEAARLSLFDLTPRQFMTTFPATKRYTA